MSKVKVGDIVYHKGWKMIGKISAFYFISETETSPWVEWFEIRDYMINPMPAEQELIIIKSDIYKLLC